jgi:TPR repeat protein
MFHDQYTGHDCVIRQINTATVSIGCCIFWRLAMRKSILTTLAALVIGTAAHAEPTKVEAILIKQFLICDEGLAAGCESFGNSAFSDALIVFTGAVENGSAAAQNNIAMLYETGAGVVKNDAKASRHYLIAAEAGIPIAQYNLAMLTVTKHVIGEATEPGERDTDMATAYMWLTIASEQGLALAMESLQELGDFMSEQAIATANQRIQAKQRK